METINFGKGHPSNDLLPYTLMQKAGEDHLRREKHRFLQYGEISGEIKFRQLLAKFLEQNYKISVAAKQLLITCGASQGLDLICQHFTKPGDTVFVEEPTYFLAFQIFADHGLKLVSIPTNKDGLNFEQLEKELKRNTPAFFYTIPIFQNPAGSTLTITQRQKLAKLSEKYNFLIVADEVYHLLNYFENPPLPFMHYDTHEKVLSLGSFSKILAPGLRLGWIHACPALLKTIKENGVLNSGGGFNHFTAGLVSNFLKLGFQQKYLQHLKQVYSKRCKCLHLALAEYLPDIAFSPATGGYFLWLKLPPKISAQKLLDKAKNYYVEYHPGNKFSTQQNLDRFIRISFSFYNEDILEDGIKRLSKAIKTL